MPARTPSPARRDGSSGTPPLRSGRVLVRSTPAGAHVWLDGKESGVTPLTLRELDEGAHTIRVLHDGYISAERRIVVTDAHPASSLTIELEKAREAPARNTAPSVGTTGELFVDSRPTGANVFVDGKLAGQTPLTLKSVSTGDHTVHLEHGGYRRWSSPVKIVAGEQSRLTASLEQ